jgi:hypothetical protein
MLMNINYNFKNKGEVKFRYILNKYSSCKVIKKFNSNKVVTKKIMVITKFDDEELVICTVLVLLLGIGIGMMISQHYNNK